VEFKELYQKPLQYFKHIFLTGFLFLLPITITFSFFHFFFNLIKSWLIPIRNIEFPFIEHIPHHEIVILLIFIFIVGTLIKTFILIPLIHLIEKTLSSIPFIKTIYMGTKQLVYSFSSHDQTSFKKVIIVEYPRQNIFTIGFLTKDIPQEITGKDLIGVYIPHTPNPASGNFIMVTKDQITETDLNRQEATALIISGGIVQPHRYKKI